MDEQADPISYAVVKCLAYAARFDSPSPAAVDFIHVLKNSGTLSDDEIAEVGRRVIVRLAERASLARFRDN